MTRIVATAADYDFNVAAHAHGAEGMKRAVRAGVRSIEHGTYMDEATADLMKKRGTAFVPTMSAMKWLARKAMEEDELPEEIRSKPMSPCEPYEARTCRTG